MAVVPEHNAIIQNYVAGIAVGPDEVRKEIEGLLCWVDAASLGWEPVGGTPNHRSSAGLASIEWN